MRHLLTILLTSALACQAEADRAEPGCDPELRDLAGTTAIFVRMKRQLFDDGASFVQYCRDHATSPRSSLRKANLSRLRELADQSWRDVGDRIATLEREGSLANVTRFWIVNGFAADADADAIAALRELDAIAYVHRQTQPGSQQRLRPREPRWLDARRADERRALEMRAAAGDEAPFSVDGLEIPWNVRAVHADAAWRNGAVGAGVTIAMLDTGVLCLEPLVHALWQNPRETLDGKDNDGNGYVDDLFGWDFDGDTRFVVGDGARSHGTMCGGILAGRPWGEPRTITGIAPRAQLMVLRGMGRLRAYEYAASMGADVLSMSYMWIGRELGSYRGVFRTAHEHLAACGVVAVGGAGNFAQRAPAGRQIALPKDIPCVICAAGVDESFAIPSFSSRGPVTWQGVPFFDDYPATAPLHKPDVTGCAKDFPVWHRAAAQGRRQRIVWQDAAGYGLVVGPAGNSFAGPHAGGIAALMLSTQPELTPWRVQQLLVATCDDRGEPGWDPSFGAGLMQADAAVAAARTAVVE